MADEIDLAEATQSLHLSATLSHIRAAARSIPAGVPGECEECGHHSPRLVGGMCARCRDKAGE